MLTADTLKQQLSYYMQKLNFPEDAKADFLAALDKMCADGASFSMISDALTAYRADCHSHFTPVLERVCEICDKLSIHPYTGELLLFLCMADAMRAHYRATGYGEDLFWNALADLGYKLEECRLVYGINGSFVAKWFGGFFHLTRFALGRLQFELTTLQKPATCLGISLPVGSTAISVHIPRTGTKLDREGVLSAYREAAEYFAPAFGDRPIIMTCSSWMLFPRHAEFLAPDSNMMQFYHDFRLVSSGFYDNYASVWRVFDCDYQGDVDALPQNTSLRRAYADRVRRGEPTGSGRGFFRMRDGEIVSRA